MYAITNIAKTTNLVANKMAAGYWSMNIGNAVEKNFGFIGNDEKPIPRHME